MERIADQPVFIIYKVTDWTKYCHNDSGAILIQSGLKGWEALQKIRELNKNDYDGPLHSDGSPIGRYKYCTQKQWDKDRIQFMEQCLFK